MPNSFIREMIRDDGELFKLICEFNLFPSQYIHETWIENIPCAALFKKLCKINRCQRKLSAFIFKHFNLEREFSFNFKNRINLMGLVNAADMYKLVYYSGLAVNAGKISKVIQRDALLSLKKELGEDAYSFGLQKAPFLMGGAVFDFGDEEESNDFFSHVIYCGMKCLEAAFSGESRGLFQRILFKLPFEFSGFTGTGNTGSHKDRARILLKKIFLQEVKPAWVNYIS